MSDDCFCTWLAISVSVYWSKFTCPKNIEFYLVQIISTQSYNYLRNGLSNLLFKCLIFSLFILLNSTQCIVSMPVFHKCKVLWCHGMLCTPVIGFCIRTVFIVILLINLQIIFMNVEHYKNWGFGIMVHFLAMYK